MKLVKNKNILTYLIFFHDDLNRFLIFIVIIPIIYGGLLLIAIKYVGYLTLFISTSSGT